MTSTSSRPAIVQRALDLPPARRKTAVFATATALTAIITLALTMWLGGNLTQSTINGLAIGGTGNLTGWGLPASKMLMDISSVGVIGMLLACLLLPQHHHHNTAVRHCLKTASKLALAWAISNAALLIFSWSDVVGHPVTDLPYSSLFTDTTKAFPDAADFISSTAVAAMIAAGTRITETRRGVLILLPLSLYNLVPMALQGHASHGTILKYSLILHVIAMSLWVGGLIALLMHLRKEPTLLAIAAPRFSTLALACYAIVATTGLIAAWELLGSIPALWGSRYGVLVILKAAALITLGILGWWHRRHTIHRIKTTTNTTRTHRAFTQLAAAEIIIMAAAIATAVALSRSASPDAILVHSLKKQPKSFVVHTQPGTRT